VGTGIRTIEVVPYETSWAEAYQQEALLIRQAFGDLLVAIHHIGSTSVPGLAAKPVIDMLVEVHDLEQVDSINPKMEALGYEARGEYGIPQRRYFQKGGNQRTHQVHTFPAGHPEVGRHLRFRSYLRAHPGDAQAYAQLKLLLAAQFPHDIDGYCDGKDSFIQEIDRRAEAWAAESIQPGE